MFMKKVESVEVKGRRVYNRGIRLEENIAAGLMLMKSRKCQVENVHC